MKDIFIDNNIPQYFKNPLDEGFKTFVHWLLDNSAANKNDKAHLVISYYILKEYISSNHNAEKERTQNIVVIYELLKAQDRLNTIEKAVIDKFQEDNYTEKNLKKIGVPKKIRQTPIHNIIRWNKDLNHIPAVFLSERKMVITEDGWFTDALANLPGFQGQAIVAPRPENFNYK